MAVFCLILLIVAMVAFLAGVIGIIIADYRTKAKKPWRILTVIGIGGVVISLIGLAIFAPGTSTHKHHSHKNQNTAIENVNDSSNSNGGSAYGTRPPKSNGTQNSSSSVQNAAGEWSVSDSVRIIDISVVDGDAYSITIEASMSEGLYADYVYTSVQLGSDTYSSDAQVNGYLDVPLSCTINGVAYENFVGGISISPDEPATITYSMSDGSELPDEMVFNFAYATTILDSDTQDVISETGNNGVLTFSY
ncbi:MAG: hypothetical protein LUB61_06315 [Eggerthellaceae bacterium]|nr:hypothetical protein [Eggerthellaceae bacterium]